MKMISFPVPARDNVRDAEGRLVAELRVSLIDGQLNWDEKQVILAADLPLGTIPA